MTKTIQEIALSFFLVVCGISMLMGMVWLKPMIESQRLLIEETRVNQEKDIKGAEEIEVMLTEVGYATAVMAMTENRMIKPADANKMIEQSVTTIEAHSDRLGKLARLVNEFRINEHGRR